MIKDTTPEGLTEKYPWWSLSATAGMTTDRTDKVKESAGVFKGKNIFV
jgi:hypothetical protein